MLANRIIATLKFFDLQSFPLTAFEVHQYLVTDMQILHSKIDDKYELKTGELEHSSPAVHLDTILTQLYILTREERVVCKDGFYALAGREGIIRDRLRNYLNGLKREKLIKRYLIPTKNIPFVRGIALAGSQALGQQRKTSDIDLLIITDPNYMWTARTLLMIWFQIFGVRRHGNKTANRFCLNHYLSNPREVDAERNLYKAMEYTKLRSVVYPKGILEFQKANEKWIHQFFPNVTFSHLDEEKIKEISEATSLQRNLEKLFHNSIGKWLEQQLGNWQKQRIRQDQFVFVREDELSFHPESKHESLLQGFFKEKRINHI